MGFEFGLGSLVPGDNGITATVNKIRESVYYALRSTQDIRLRAESAIAGCSERDDQCEVTKVFEWMLKHFRYVRDPRGLEFVKSPEYAMDEINRTGQFQGDCDDASAFLAALMTSIGYQVKLVVIAVQGQDDNYRHIYPMVYLPRKKEWFALEATARQREAGWEAPTGSRRREYSL